MDQENKEELEHENEAQSPGDIDENESITEFISNMNFVNIKPCRSARDRLWPSAPHIRSQSAPPSSD